MEFAKEHNAKRTMKMLQVLDKRLQGYNQVLGMIKFVLIVVISVELEAGLLSCQTG